MVKLNLQFFGGRGSSSGVGTGKMTIQGFLKNFRNASVDNVKALQYEVGETVYSENGNSLKMQSAVAQNGPDKIEVSFYSTYNPMQTTRPQKAIKTMIEVRHYKNENIQGLKTIMEKKSVSLKNSRSNYEDVLKQWKEITKQKKIRF